MKLLTGRISLIVIVVLLAACIVIFINERRNYEQTELGQFNLVLTFGEDGRDSLDTFDGKVSKVLNDGGVAFAEFTLSDKERKRILGMLEGMDILSYPADLDIGPCDAVHSEKLNLHVKMDGVVHDVSWTIPCDYGFITDGRLSVLHKRFLELVLYIKEIVYGSEEYQSLPGAEGGYFL